MFVLDLKEILLKEVFWAKMLLFHLVIIVVTDEGQHLPFKHLGEQESL